MAANQMAKRKGTNNDTVLKTEDGVTRTSLKTEVDSCASKRWVVSALLVTPVLLPSLIIR